LGDSIRIDWDSDEGRLVFEQEGEGMLIVSPAIPRIAAETKAAGATGGRDQEIPILATSPWQTAGNRRA
jgi:hypothetical protein